MLRWFRSDEVPEEVRAQLRDVSGIVVVGDVHGDVRQLAAQARPLRLDWKPLRGNDPLSWLHWKSRLAPTLVGREREMESLRRWANEGEGVRARVISGEGGVGKTRLAAELAQELRDQGWQAGFADLKRSREGAEVYGTSPAGTLVLLDYPEEHREATRELLRDLAALETADRLRVLLLSRRGDELWQPEIDRADAYDVFDEGQLELGSLPTEGLYEIFQEARSNVPTGEQLETPAEVTAVALSDWLRGKTAHRRPLFALAAAIESALDPKRPVVRLTGRQVIEALARRELTRLRDEGVDAGLHKETLPRLVAMAALAGGLDSKALRSLAGREDHLELGLPAPSEVFNQLQATGRLLQSDGERALPAPSPDLVAAAMVVQVLGKEPELAPERLWAALEGDLANGLERVGRLAYDAEVTLGLLENRPSEWLRKALEENPARCSLAAPSFYESVLPAGLLPAAPGIWRALLEGNLEEEHRAKLLNNLSVHLAAAGRVEEALSAIEEAVAVRRRLSNSNPARYEPDLAQSLNNLSLCLSEAGRTVEALSAIEEALAIYRRLSNSNPARYEPELAMSLNNLSLRLSEAGRVEEALSAIEEAVEVYRRLSNSNPARYEPELAMSLNNLSLRLSGAGRVEEALSAIEEALAIRRRLSISNPARYEPDLASSLNNLSNRLSEAGRVEEAMSAIEEALAIGRRLSISNPARYEPDLARRLNNLSLCLSEAGPVEEALSAIEEAVEISRRLSISSPARYEPDLAYRLDTLSRCLSEAGRVGEALDAQREAAALIEPYAQKFPEGLHGQWGAIILRRLEELGAEEAED